MATNVHVALERIASKDKDFRYMGTSDLLAELNADQWKVDPETEKRVCHVLLQQLDDHSGEISGLTVKCLVRLTRHVSEYKVSEMATSLMNKITTGKDSQRDIASIALKALLQETPPGPSAQALAAVLPTLLIQGISSSTSSQEVVGECLDVLHDTLQRFGVSLPPPDQERLLGVLLSQLSSPKPALRKKSSQCLASLAAGMPDDLLSRTLSSVVQLLKKREGGKGEAVLLTSIQTVAGLSRSVGHRFAPVLPEVLPLIMKFCRNASEQDVELREYCLQALETVVLRTPHNVASEIGSILSLALECLSFDPNFTDDDPGDAMDQDGEEGEEDEEDEEDEDYSDDEDMSWKVRRAAAKCISAVITSRTDNLQETFAQACPVLIDRFREREETVKIDVFGTFMDLLIQTGEAIQHHHGYSTTLASQLQAEIPKSVKALTRQLKEKSIKTRVGVFSVLKELVQVLPNSLTGYTQLVIPGVQKALQDKTSNSAIKIEALLFTRLLLSSHDAATSQPYLKDLVPAVKLCVGDKYYKVTSEALRVTGEMVKVMRPSVATVVLSRLAAPVGARDTSAAPPTGGEFDFKPLVAPVHDAILSRLTAQDQDQEVKESAISSMALLISLLGDSLQPSQLNAALGLFVERLKNDITRLAAVKALNTVAVSPIHPDMSGILEPAVSELTSFLRKANRPLRQASLVALTALVGGYSEGISTGSMSALVAELSQLVSDSDLAMAALALELCCTVLGSSGARNKEVSSAVNEKVQPQALDLVRSPLLQGQALMMLQRFFVEQVRVGNTSFEALLEALLACGKAGAIQHWSQATGPSGLAASSAGGTAAGSRAALSSVAQCIAVLCVAAGKEQCKETVSRLHSAVQAALAGAKKQASKGLNDAVLPLLTLGEIGRRTELPGLDRSGLEQLIMEAFSSASEEVKSAASFCLGSIAAGNQGEHLPLILQRIDDPQGQRQYLLLLALKEVISCGTHSGNLHLGGENVSRILSLLLTHSASEEEGVRNVVAECLGRLILIDPSSVLPALTARTGDSSAFTRAVVATALKFALLDAHLIKGMEQHLTASTITPFLMLIRDSDRHVRKAAVLALGTAVHNRSGVVEESLPELLPLLYDQMRVKPELVRTVDLGPFKHEVDDGLELRKSAFDCMDTLLGKPSTFRRIQASAFITPFLLSGLSDKYDDVKMPCHLILAKLSLKDGAAVLSVLDSLLDPLEKTISRKAKENAVKQEADRIEDMVRSGLRAIDALSRLSNVEASARFKALMTKIKQTPHLAALFAAIKQEDKKILAE